MDMVVCRYHFKVKSRNFVNVLIAGTRIYQYIIPRKEYMWIYFGGRRCPPRLRTTTVIGCQLVMGDTNFFFVIDYFDYFCD